MLNPTKSVLLKTSAGTDVQYVGGNLSILGLDEAIPQSRIVNFSQANYRAEVRQVVKAGYSTYTPVASKVYTVTINDPNRRNMGMGEQAFSYSYKTPATLTDIGATAADQREAIHLALIAKINLISSNFVAGATLGTGTGFTVTDDAGYYPAPSQTGTGRQGASTVKVSGGFLTTDIITTTAAVYALGVGAALAAFAPVVDYATGNVISGDVVGAPKAADGTYATAGQKYNVFNISYFSDSSLPTISSEYRGLTLRNAQVWVDNGAGSDVTNLAGYIALERQLHRGLFNKFDQDPSAQVDFLDNVILFQGAAGAVPTATGENKMVSDAKWVYNQIGTQTALTTPTPGVDGLILDQVLAGTEGAEYTPSLLTSAPQEFVVGKGEFSVFARLKAADWTDAAFQVGFRKKAAHAADFNNYTDLASVGTLAADGDLVVTNGILNNAATVSTSTAVIPTNAAYLTVEVLVAASGLVTCKLNDVKYPVYSAGTTALILDAGDIMIPFVLYKNISTGDPDLVLNEIAAVPTIWKY